MSTTLKLPTSAYRLCTDDDDSIVTVVIVFKSFFLFKNHPSYQAEVNAEHTLCAKQERIKQGSASPVVLGSRVVVFIIMATVSLQSY